MQTEPGVVDDGEATAAERLEPGTVQLPDLTGDLSPAERLRKARREGLEEKFATVDVPEYPDDLRVVVRYHSVQGAQIEAIQQRAQKFKGSAKGTRACLEILAAACEGVYVRMPDHEKADPEGLVNIATVFDLADATPVRFGDPRLGQALEFDHPDKDPALIAVRETFCRNEPAIIATQEALSRWFVDRTREVNSDLLGG